MNRWIALFALALAGTGCGKKIGDECESATECISTDTDRICLTQTGEGFPDGYCSQFNCSPDSCPEEASCVAYRRTLAGGECADQANRSRLERTYCMLTCNKDSDCRSGYKCLKADGDNPLGATVIDRDPDVKICTLEYVVPDEQPERQSAVCEVQVFNQPASSGSSSSDSPGDAAADGAVDGAVGSDGAVVRDGAAGDAASSTETDAASVDAASDAASSDVSSDASSFDAALDAANQSLDSGS